MKESRKPASLQGKSESSSNSNKASEQQSKYLQNLSNNPELLMPSSNNSLSSKCKRDIMDSILKNSNQKKSFEHILQKEKIQNEVIAKRKKTIDNINLIEDNIEGLYDWKTLFNNSRPISHYTRMYKNNKQKNSTKNDKEFKFPCALIDAPSEKFNMYFPKNSNTIHFNATRPKSVYSPREKNEIFYLSKDFSDYYLEDFKSFRKKMPILQAKKRCETAKLKRTIKKVHKEEEKAEKILHDSQSALNIYRKQSIVISNRELSLAINKNNAEPLLNSIHQQMIKAKSEASSLNNSMRRNKSIDESCDLYVKQNNTSLNNSSWYMSNNIVAPNTCLKIDTYDENDPDLQIFHQIEEIKEESVPSLQKSPRDNNKSLTSRNTLNIKPQNNSSRRPLSSSSSHTILSNRIISTNLRKNKMISNVKSTIVMNHGTNTSLIQGIRNANKKALVNKYEINKQVLSSSSSNENFNNQTNDNTLSSVCEYIPVKAMPIRTNSKIQNFTYGQIDKHLKEKQNNINEGENTPINKLLKRGISAVSRDKKLKRPMSCVNIHSMKIDNTTVQEEKPTIKKQKHNHRVNMVYFNDYIDTVFPKEIVIYSKDRNNVLPMNYYNKPSARGCRPMISKGKINTNEYYMNVMDFNSMSSSRYQSLTNSSGLSRRVMSAKVGTH